MPGKPKHPKDRPRVKATDLQALATLALAVKSEVDCLLSTTPFGSDRWIWIEELKYSEATRRFSCLGTSQPEGDAPRFPTIAAVRWLTILSERIAAERGFDDQYESLRMTTDTTFDTLPPLCQVRKVHKIHVLAAHRFLSSVLPLLSELQGIPYRLNQELGGIISAYIAVLVNHHRGRAVRSKKVGSKKSRSMKGRSSTHQHALPTSALDVMIQSWDRLIQEFKNESLHSRYQQLHILSGSPARRKRAGEVAHDIGLIRIMSTKRVQVLLPGLTYHNACEAAIKANQPLPEIFPSEAASTSFASRST